MQKLHEIKGKTIREWAAEDLPHGRFIQMVREIDPCYGVFAEAGAKKRVYKVVRSNPADHPSDYDEIEVEAFNEMHARGVAWDEHHWNPRHTRARPLSRKDEDKT